MGVCWDRLQQWLIHYISCCCSYSIENAVDDLELLIRKVGLRKFHLLGHSFGGILGYEFLKRVAERSEENPSFEVLSFTLASTPTSVPLVESEVQNLLASLMTEQENSADESTVEERFQQSHICRTPERPQALTDAYNYAGTVWRGTQAIADYVATPPSDSAAALPPAMVLRGEHDFVTQACIQDWKGKLWNHNRMREKVVAGCAHHGVLENGFVYGDIIDSYCTEYDP
jgi:proline iminopeptidase